MRLNICSFCITQVYDTNLTLSMTEMIEVVRFVCLREKYKDESMNTEEFNQPNSSIPRLHAVTINKLQYCNPLLHHSLGSIDICSIAIYCSSGQRLSLSIDE